MQSNCAYGVPISARALRDPAHHALHVALLHRPAAAIVAKEIDACVPAPAQILADGDLRLCVEVAAAMLFALTQQMHRARRPVDIAQQDARQLAHAASGAVKHLNDCRLSGGSTCPANPLKLNLLQRFPRLRFLFDGFDRLSRIR